MKVTFPLSLKISLWLLANFLLLGAAAVVALQSQGGWSWGALVRGPAGERLLPLAQSVMADLSAADPDQRSELLAGLDARYNATFSVFDADGTPWAGAPVTLPESILNRVIAPPSPPRGGGPREGFGPGPGTERPPLRPGPGSGRSPDEGRGRFHETTAEPRAHWVGIRTRLPGGAGGRAQQATVVVRTTSSWSLIQLLDLQVWFWAAGSVFALSVLFWLPLVHGITRALKQLTLATEQIAEGRFETRVGTRRRDELGHLGESINSMAARLETLVHGQKRFLGDIAHELGSPIGRLQVAIEILEQRSEPGLRAQVSDVREEVQQMSALVHELLAFTQAGLRPRTVDCQSIELRPLVETVVAREAGPANVTLSLPAHLRVRADGPLLSRALGNLVRNAVRYAGSRDPISLEARVEGSRVILSVDDLGPGVPPESLARLGEPFYRPEAARTRDTGGVGLGLAIVRSAITACNGEVHFANRTPRGFHAEVHLDRG